MKYAYVIRYKSNAIKNAKGRRYLAKPSYRYKNGHPYNVFPNAEIFLDYKRAVDNTLFSIEEVVKVKRMPSGNYKIVEVMN